jgi:hypothetical protein
VQDPIINHFQLSKFLFELFSNLRKKGLKIGWKKYYICLGDTVGKLSVDVTGLNCYLLPQLQLV